LNIAASLTPPPNHPQLARARQEGICHDFENSPRIAKLLYYESSRLPAGETTSFDEYISRCDPEQVNRAQEMGLVVWVG